ncbi:class I SAM-dependent methyltransferase [Dermabacteraceae bacterium P7006]
MENLSRAQEELSRRLADPARPASFWEQKVEAQPGHSDWYIQRFEGMREMGKDLLGEARAADALVERGASILDAGCGPGRIALRLAALGHRVTGVDIDEKLLAAARADLPVFAPEAPHEPVFLHGDICTLSPDAVPTAPFDLIVCAGNVITFLAAGSQAQALAAFASLLAPKGRIIIGFGLQRGYSREQFLADIEAAGLKADAHFATWDFRPAEEDEGFTVSLLSRA